MPALLSGKRVLISTGTRTLQDQLFNKDLPLVAGAIGGATWLSAGATVGEALFYHGASGMLSGVLSRGMLDLDEGHLSSWDAYVGAMNVGGIAGLAGAGGAVLTNGPAMPVWKLILVYSINAAAEQGAGAWNAWRPLNAKEHESLNYQGSFVERQLMPEPGAR